MSIKAGEIARETGTYSCEGCSAHVRVDRGAVIGECRNCGRSSFRMVPLSFVQQAEAYRRRAEEVRTAAEEVSESCREALHRTAATYEHLADCIERVVIPTGKDANRGSSKAVG